MKAKRLIVEGQVQRVGYRDYIQLISREIGVRGYIKNDEEDRFKVEILAIYDDESKYKAFLEKVKTPPFPASVSSVEEKDVIVDEEEDKKYKFMHIIRGDPTEELAERLDQAMHFFRSLDRKQDGMLEKQDLMLEKQDITINAIKELSKKQDITINAMNELNKKQDITINTIKELNTNMQSRFDHLDEKYGAISQKLDRIATALEKLITVLEKGGLS